MVEFAAAIGKSDSEGGFLLTFLINMLSRVEVLTAIVTVADLRCGGNKHPCVDGEKVDFTNISH